MADVADRVSGPYATGNIYDRRKPPSKRPKRPFSLEHQEEEKASRHKSKNPPKDELVISMPVHDTETDDERVHPEKELGQFIDLTG